MGKSIVNIKSIKKCAFCKYWYDPTNAAINPKSPKQNIWEYENTAKCKCLQRNISIIASSVCSKYECKLEIL